MKKYYIFPKHRSLRENVKSWGFIEQDDSGVSVIMKVRPIHLPKFIADKIQTEIIRTLRKMGFVVERKYKAKDGIKTRFN